MFSRQEVVHPSFVCVPCCTHATTADAQAGLLMSETPSQQAYPCRSSAYSQCVPLIAICRVAAFSEYILMGCADLVDCQSDLDKYMSDLNSGNFLLAQAMGMHLWLVTQSIYPGSLTILCFIPTVQQLRKRR